MGRVFTPRTVGALVMALLSFALLVTGAPLWLVAVGSLSGLIVMWRYQWRYGTMFDDVRRRWREDTRKIEAARRQREAERRSDDD